MPRRYEFIRLADQAIRFKIVDGETLDESPILWINDASVIATLFDANGDAVAPPVTLLYESDTDGEYRGLLESSGPESPSREFDPPVGVGYRLEIVVETPAGANRTFNFPASVVDG